MNPKRTSRKRGFSLIEVVAVLLLVGVLAAVAGLGVIPMAQGFLIATRNGRAVQKAQAAIARAMREFTTITDVVSGTASAITYDHLDQAGVSRRHTLSWAGAGSPLRLGADTLTDDVRSFSLSYLDSPASAPQAAWTASSSGIHMILQIDSTGTVYTNRVFPRTLAP